MCAMLAEHCETIKRPAHVFNMDPAADNLPYTPSKDIRDLIDTQMAMEQADLGPNGALVACLEYEMKMKTRQQTLADI